MRGKFRCLFAARIGPLTMPFIDKMQCGAQSFSVRTRRATYPMAHTGPLPREEQMVSWKVRGALTGALVLGLAGAASPAWSAEAGAPATSVSQDQLNAAGMVCF